MKGAHRVIVETKKIKYDFVVKRNITILTGDSGSGKTVLIDYIRDYRRYGADSGVFVSCDCDCRTLDNEDWERQLEEITGSIVFIDEGNRFLPTQRFAELVQQSDNYFVIATREKLPMLPYSIKEIDFGGRFFIVDFFFLSQYCENVVESQKKWLFLYQSCQSQYND